MKPEEAILMMRNRIDTASEIAGKGTDGKAFEDMEMAIEALKEIQQYREIGTVEECRDAVEKTKAKKCVQDTCPDHTHYKCPTCGKIQMSEYKRGIRILGRITNFCDNCGRGLESEK